MPHLDALTLFQGHMHGSSFERRKQDRFSQITHPPAATEGWEHDAVLRVFQQRNDKNMKNKSFTRLSLLESHGGTKGNIKRLLPICLCSFPHLSILRAKIIIINLESIKFSIYMQVGEGNGNPLQYSCLENPMDGGAW